MTLGPVEASTFIWNLISICVLLLMLQFAWIPLLHAEFRHDLFSLRRRLFLLVAEGKIRGDEPAYRALTSQLNALLARAEDISGLQVIFSVMMFGAEATQLNSERSKMINRVKDAAVRSEFKSISQETSQAVARHIHRLIPISPSIWAVLLIHKLLPQPSRKKNKSTAARSIELEAMSALRMA